MERNLPNEVKQSKHIRIKPTVYRKARLSAFESEKSLAQWLEEAIKEKRYRFLCKNKERRGFVSWKKIEQQGEDYLWINNLIVWKKGLNLWKLKKFFTELYPDINYYFYDRKKKKYYYKRRR